MAFAPKEKSAATRSIVLTSDALEILEKALCRSAEKRTDIPRGKHGKITRETRSEILGCDVKTIDRIYRRQGVSEATLRHVFGQVGLLWSRPHNVLSSPPPSSLAIPSSHSLLESPATPMRGNIPLTPTHSIARPEAMMEIRDRIANYRLVTLTGSGGIGKTWLAKTVANAVQTEFPEGVWWVDITDLQDERQIVTKIAKSLGIIEEAQCPLRDTLIARLHTQRLLLVVDNCEHLIYETARLMEALLTSCPHLRLLATSRQMLGLSGEECIWRVPSLATPDPAHLPQNTADHPLFLQSFPAVQLFVERAKAVQQHFALTASNSLAVARICHRLDGIPLALQLAAARVRMLSGEEIATRLEENFALLTERSSTSLPRHQTLHTLIDWSYALLTEKEQRLLCNLSVFVGGWTLAAAERVCRDCSEEEEGSLRATNRLMPEEIQDTLFSLVDKSLVLCEVNAETGRYRTLEMVRQYARTLLDDSPQKERLQTQHLDFFLGFAEHAEPQLHGREQSHWLDTLEYEHDNFRAALRWAELHSSDKGLRLCGVLSCFWLIRTHFTEGIDCLESFLKRTETASALIRAKALQGLGQLCFYHDGDYKRARAYLQQSAAIWRENDDSPGLSGALVYLAFACNLLGETETATRLAEEGTHHAQLSQDNWTLAMALWGQGWIQQRIGHEVEAVSLLEASLNLFRRIGDAWGICGPITYLIDIQINQRQFEAARLLGEEGLESVRTLHERWRLGSLLDTMGSIASAMGDYVQARIWYEESLAVCRELQSKRRIAYELRSLGDLARKEGQWDEAHLRFQQSMELYQEIDWKPGSAIVLGGMACLASVQGRAARAARLFGAAEALNESVSRFSAYSDYTACKEAACSALGEAGFRIEMERGRILSPEQAGAYAALPIE